MEEDFAQQATERSMTFANNKLFAVHNAESLAASHGVYLGQTYDSDLSHLGTLQARALARHLYELGISTVISSPLNRVYQTALEIARIANLEVVLDERLIEINHGFWEGKERSWVTKHYPELFLLWQTNPGSVVFPGGEAFMDCVNRVEEFLHSTEINNHTVIVTHDNIIRIMIALSEEDGVNLYWKVPIEPAAVTFFECNRVGSRSRLRLISYNESGHLNGLHTNLENHAL